MSAKFCNECGKKLAPEVLTKTIESRLPSTKIDFHKLERTVQILEGKRKADIMFVLDCTGSMQGEIDAIRDAITDFADTIQSDGVRVRVGLVEFRGRSRPF